MFKNLFKNTRKKNEGLGDAEEKLKDKLAHQSESQNLITQKNDTSKDIEINLKQQGQLKHEVMKIIGNTPSNEEIPTVEKPVQKAC